MTLHAYRKDGTEVKRGDKVTDFRGNKGTFLSATQPATFGKSGKVYVNDDAHNYPGEFYDKVFDLVVRDDTQE